MLVTGNNSNSLISTKVKNASFDPSRAVCFLSFVYMVRHGSSLPGFVVHWNLDKW